MLPRSICIELGLVKKTFTLKECDISLSGLNKKKFYIDELGHDYISKIEKDRQYQDVFPRDIVPTLYDEIIENEQKKYDINQARAEKIYGNHKIQLQNISACFSVVSANLAGSLFKDFLRVPENILYRIGDGFSVIFSKMISKEERFTEFLSEVKCIKSKNIRTPIEWRKKELPKRENLEMSVVQAEILGEIYYIALLMGHWDILNNINLTNSGTVIDSGGHLKPAIVDWGNCLGVGFGGVSAEESSFRNPEFPGLCLEMDDPITGFKACVPFDKVVYPLLPRQLVRDLFNLGFDDTWSKAMLTGFKKAHDVAKKNFSGQLVSESIDNTFKNFIDINQRPYFEKILNQTFFFYRGSDKEVFTLENVLEGRLHSLEGLIERLNKGEKWDDIARIQLDKIIKSQEKSKKATAAGIQMFNQVKMCTFSPEKEESSFSIFHEVKQSC